ncbi:DNA-directed RNA polymerase III subunit RPC6 [Nymphon striatum]|nr:DNA-directed RNA polymerase III subunit RPC6 [Nymphon striatum]
MSFKIYVSHTLRCTDDYAEQQGLIALHFALRYRINYALIAGIEEHVLNLKIMLYADDAKIYLMAQNQADTCQFQEDLNRVCKSNADGITDANLQGELPNVDAQQRVAAINSLLNAGKLDLLQKNKQLIYKLKSPSTVRALDGSDHDEKLAYQVIEEANNKGIWIRDLRIKCNIPLNRAQKIVKNFLSKKLIKEIKCVNAPRKKYYMLYDIKPHQSVTGGIWYSDQEFEYEFIDILNQQCFRYLKQRRDNVKLDKSDPVSQKNSSFASLPEVCKYIADTGISKVTLSEEDIEEILNSLIYDRKVEKSIVPSTDGSSENIKLFRVVEPMLPTAGLMRIPCGVCPVFSDCQPNGVISPTTCVYMKDWLGF